MVEKFSTVELIHIIRYMTTSFVEVGRQAAVDHMAIVTALARRDTEAAEENMKLHLCNALNIVMSFDEQILTEQIIAKTE